jgi:hypothetical protein
MAHLEDLQPTAAVRGILPDQVVTVISVQWFGSEALELTYKAPSGRVANELLYRHDESRLEIVEYGRPWSIDGDGSLFRLVSEAHRIRLARLFDPVLAVHTLLVEPLPHQITAVYEAMLPRQPLRFLLADTIMADAAFPVSRWQATCLPRITISLSFANSEFTFANNLRLNSCLYDHLLTWLNSLISAMRSI